MNVLDSEDRATLTMYAIYGGAAFVAVTWLALVLGLAVRLFVAVSGI